MKVLDCTLRDGGYYTDWHFDENVVKHLVAALDLAGVDIIELGYRSRILGGVFRRCEEDKLQFINEPKNAKFCFMIDIKDYKDSNGNFMYSYVYEDVKQSKDSIFDYCRIATRIEDLNIAITIADDMHNKGYGVMLNVMCASQLTVDDLHYITKSVTDKPYSAIYIADSYGALRPDVLQAYVLILKESGIPVGLHLHDNQGLAFANALAALSVTAEFIDATMCGMGRGVGNLKIEQLLLMLRDIEPRYNSNELFQSLHEFQMLKAKYGWGWSPSYMLAGLRNMHPFYVMKLKQRGLDDVAICEILECIPTDDYAKFNPDSLQSAVELHGKKDAIVLIPARYESSRFPGKPLVEILGVPMVVRVARLAAEAVGRENVYVATDSEDIKNVVSQHGFSVVMTNDALTGTDRIAEAVQNIDANVIVSIQGDEPLLDPELIHKVIKAKTENSRHVINCMASFDPEIQHTNNTSIPKVVVNAANELLYASRASIPSDKLASLDKYDVTKKQVCVYAFNKSQLIMFAEAKAKTPLEQQEDIEILRFLELGIPVKMVETENCKTHAVDWPRDVEIIEKLLNEKI